MKKNHFLFILTATFFFTACKKDKTPETPTFTCTTCKSTPDAIAANNSLSKGIYKGVIIGSTGTIMFDIANNGTSITAVMVLDGLTVNLTSTVLWVSGQPYVSPFTGTLNGQAISITFSVGATGGTPTVTSSNIPGHTSASFNIIKETSAGLVECFEGTYSTTLPETGTFNIILSRSLGIWSGVARKTGATTTSNPGTGTITNNNLIDPSQNNKSIGTLNNDALNGSFMDNNGKTVTLTGKRSL
jgi:hypothetical protein